MKANKTLQTIFSFLLAFAMMINGWPLPAVHAAPAMDLTTGLVAWYKLDEGSGAAAADSSGSGNNATTVNGPTWATGKIGLSSLILNGTNQSVTALNTASLNITGPITLAAWIKPGRLINATQDIVKKAANGNSAGNGYELSLANNGKAFFRLNQYSSANTYRIDSTTNYPLNGLAWMHIAGTYDGTTIKIYINGTAEGSVAGPVQITSNLQPLTIGTDPITPTGRYYQGGLDDIRVYNRALSANEISALANPPLAVADTYPILEDTPLNISSPGILANDSGNGSLTATLLTFPSHGTLSLNSDGSFSYNPAANYNGPDSFTYLATSGGVDSQPATVSLTVTPVNDPPVCVDVSLTTIQDTEGQVAPGCTDVDSTSFTYSIASQPANGSASIVNNKLVYNPQQGFTGSDHFTYQASDGGDPSNTAAVDVTVTAVTNRPPVLATIADPTIDEQAELSFVVSATDPDEDPITYALDPGFPAGASIDSTSGTFTWTPTEAQGPGSYPITVRASDGNLADTKTFTVTVNEVNLSPLVTSPPDQTSTAGKWVSLQIQASDPDLPTQSLSYSAADLPAGLSINAATGLISGTIHFQAAASSPFAVTVSASDGLLSGSKTFSWVVNPSVTGVCVSDPSLVGCWQMEEEAGTIVLDGSGSLNNGTTTGNPVWAAGHLGQGLSLNGTSQYATIPDSTNLDITGAITLAVWVAPGKAGTQDLIKKATLSSTTPVDGYEISLSSANKPFFRLNQKTNGDTYRINGVTNFPTDGNTWMHLAATYDGTTMRLYVNGVQEGGNLAGPAAIVANDLPLGIGVQGNLDTARLFKGKVDDVRIYNRALSDGEIAALAGAPVNHAPVAGNDAYSTAEDTPLVITAPGVLSNDSDMDGDPLTAIVATGPTHGSLVLNANGGFTYTPNANYSGSDSFTYRASDGKLTSDPATVGVSVSSANTAPVLAAIGNQTVAELTALTFTASATDADGDSLTFSLDAGAPSGAAINPATGVFTWTPTEAQGPGSYPVTIRVSDGTASDLETITIQVNEVNLPPIIANPGDQTNAEGAVVSLQIQASDPDVPGNTLSFTAANLPAGLNINAATGLISGTIGSNAASSSPYNTQLTVNDGNGGSVSASFTWTVTHVTQPPSGLSCVDLQPKPMTADTSDKPQSKVWQYAGAWWAVFPTSASGASSAGTWLWKLEGSAWAEVLKLSTSTTARADVKSNGDLAHILLYASTSTQLVSVEYSAGTYQLWENRPAPANISLPNSETATIDIDSNGRMWLSTENDTAGAMIVYYSDTPYSTWNGPITIATGVNADDISVVTAMPGNKVGVFWSNQNTKRFGFRVHQDGSDPSTWGADEVPASQSALNVGSGMADDHLNVAVASDGTLYAAVKTSYDTAGYPKVALLVRRPDGVWDNLYNVDDAGTRGMILLDEAHGILTYVYTSAEGYNDIVYRQSSLQNIAFDSRKTMRSSGFNDASSTKQNYNDELVVIFHSSSQIAGEICSSVPSSGADLLITKDDNLSTVRLGDTLTYTLLVRNAGPEAVTGASVADNLPAVLTNATWTCAASSGASCTTSGTGSIHDLVNLPVNGTTTYTLTARVNVGDRGDITNTATVSAPAGVTDPRTSNNSATDTDSIVVSVTPCESDSSLVGCWQMEEGSGTALMDGSTYANDAALYGTPGWGTGKVGSYTLNLNGTSQYGLVPDDASLDLSGQLTLAAWIRPEQYATQSLINKATNGGINGYELSLATTKTDASSQRAFFRINQAGSGDTYRINANTMYPIDGTWMHVAATYDGVTLRLYINGILESSLTPTTAPTIPNNTLPLGIGAQIDTQNIASRWFKGGMDEVRVYNRALSAAEIAAMAHTNLAPDQPVLSAPQNGATNVDSSPVLDVVASDPDDDPLTVKFYGRSATAATGEPFTLVALPDTQHYPTSFPATFSAQTQWIVNNRAGLNIAFVAHEGDVVTTAANTSEWSTAVAAMSLLEDPQTTSLPYGIPFGIAPGNHDLQDSGANYNVYYGVNHFTGRPYYGGHSGTDNNNNYELFSAGGMDFIILHLASGPNASTLAWAGDRLSEFPNRRAIVVSHDIIGTGNPASFSASGQAIYTALKVYPNLFLMLCGHMAGEGMRSDIYNGHTVTTLLADYQSRSNGGDGWLRILQFSPAEGKIHVKTYSPTLNQYETDTDSQFDLSYAMASDSYQLLGTAAVNSGAHATYTWNNLASSASYQWYATVSDGSLTTQGPVWSFTTQRSNQAPVAANGTAVTNEDTQAAIQLTASDADGDTLTYTVVTQPQHGTLSGTAPNLTYMPEGNYYGADSLTFSVNDGRVDSNQASFAITVQPVNDAPAFTKGLDQVISEDSPEQTVANWASGITPGPQNESSQTINFSVTNDHPDLFTAGPSITSAGTLSYTPAPGKEGEAEVSVKIHDDGGTENGGVDTSTPQTFTITITQVNHAPVANAQSVITAEDTSLPITLTGSDSDGDPLTYSVVIQPQHGTLSGTGENQSYLPDANFNGSDSFTFKVNDSHADSAVATVDITITPVNDAPVANDQSVTTAEDTPKTITLTGSDVESSPLTFSITSDPSHGSLSGTAPNVTYTPAADYSGTDSFTYKVNDGSLDSNTATVDIIVTAVNDAPLAGNDSYSTNQDTVLTVAAPGVLENDIDVDSSTLTAVIVKNPLHGALSLTANGAFTYTPDTGYSGSDSFTYQANDGSANSNVATVSITVTHINHAPLAAADSYITNEDTALTISAPGVLDNDNDVDGQNLTAIPGSNPASGTLTLKSDGSFIYTPGTNFNGSDSFTYRANDGITDSNVATVTITVQAVNDAPVADAQSITTGQETTKDITLTGSDVEGSSLTFTIVNGPAHGTLSGTAPDVTYTPAANYNGPDSFTFKASDGQLDSNVATVSITVTPGNHAPVAQDQPVTAQQDTPVNITIIATDSDSDPLAYSIVTGPAHGTLSGPAPNLTYTPNGGYTGSDNFTFKVNDGKVDSNTATVSITVMHVNHPPVAVGNSYGTDEDMPLTVTAAQGVLNNDTDVDGDPLSVVKETNPAHGTLTLNADGSFTYTPAANWNGIDSFTYKVNDTALDSNIATVTITVKAIPETPSGLQSKFSTVAINLDWDDDSVDTNLAGYNIYRSSTTVYTRLNALPLTTSSYQDLSAEVNVEYSYQVTVVDLAGLESAPATLSAKRLIAFRSASSASNKTSSILTVPAPTGIQPGDVMVAAISVQGAPMITAPGGWIKIRNDATADNTLRQALYYTIAASGEPPSFSWSFTSPQAASGGIIVYSGVDNNNPIGASSGQANLSSTRYTAPSVLTASNVELLVGFFGIAGNAIVTPPGGMLEHVEISTASGKNKVTTEIADEILVSEGNSGDRTATGDRAVANIGQLLALLPANTVPVQDTKPPTVPADLSANAVSANQVDLTWSPSTDNVAVTGYTVYRDGMYLGTTTVARYSDTKVSHDTTYQYQVDAFDAAGNHSAKSSLVIVETPPLSQGIQFIGAASGSTQSASTTLIINRPSAAISGNLLLASIDLRDGATITPPTNWTKIIETHNGTSLTKVTYYRVVGVGEPASYVWTFSAPKVAAGIILAYSGVDPNSPVLAFAGQSNSTGTSLNAPSVYAPASGSVLVTFYGLDTSAAITQPTTMTERAENSGSAGKIKVTSEAADQWLSAVGDTGIRTATASKAELSIGQSIVLKPASQ